MQEGETSHTSDIKSNDKGWQTLLSMIQNTCTAMLRRVDFDSSWKVPLLQRVTLLVEFSNVQLALFVPTGPWHYGSGITFPTIRAGVEFLTF